MDIEQLDEEQLGKFDKEHVNDRRWTPINRCIDRDFPDGEFKFLDLGGGNGLFADRVLANYPKSTCVVLDSSRSLLNKNKLHSRKRTVFDSVENLHRYVDEKYDLIFFNWLLHHLVGKTYSQSKENIKRTLRSAKSLLANEGRLSIYENMYNGLIIDRAPSWIVYHLTSSKAMAKLVKRRANTAGVGVCFFSYKRWCSVLRQSGFRVLDYTNDDVWNIHWTWTAFLHIKHIRCGHFWLAP
jgi:ubiquinone/menaquinone biosynthesis C-methylase UbiE